MGIIKAIWTGGQIRPMGPVDWPEGCELRVEAVVPAAGRIGLDESHWRDDADALVDWEEWLTSIERPVLTSEDEASVESFEDKFRRYNLQAVQEQMQREAGL